MALWLFVYIFIVMSFSNSSRKIFLLWTVFFAPSAIYRFPLDNVLLVVFFVSRLITASPSVNTYPVYDLRSLSSPVGINVFSDCIWLTVCKTYLDCAFQISQYFLQLANAPPHVLNWLSTLAACAMSGLVHVARYISDLIKFWYGTARLSFFSSL